MVSEQLCNGQYHIRRGRPFGKPPRQFQSYHLRAGEINWLAKNSSFCFYSTDTPADNTDPIDQRSVRIRTHQCIRKCPAIPFDHTLSKILQVDLVANSHSGLYHCEIVK